MDTKAFAYKVTAGEQPVPVLVLADSQAGQWRQSAQSVSSAYNGLVGASGTGGPGAEGEARGRPGGGRVGRSSTLANPRGAGARGAVAARDRHGGRSSTRAMGSRPPERRPRTRARSPRRSRGGRVARGGARGAPRCPRARARGCWRTTCSRSPLAPSRSARRPRGASARAPRAPSSCGSSWTPARSSPLGASSPSPAAWPPRSTPSCRSARSSEGAERSPEAQAVLRDFCAEVAPHPPLPTVAPTRVPTVHSLPPSLAGRQQQHRRAPRRPPLLGLHRRGAPPARPRPCPPGPAPARALREPARSADVAMSRAGQEVKGRIATLMFHMAKDATLANRILRQDGAVKALVGLLDSESAAVNSSAAAALANITYWSTDPVARYTHVKVLCAV